MLQGSEIQDKWQCSFVPWIRRFHIFLRLLLFRAGGRAGSRSGLRWSEMSADKRTCELFGSGPNFEFGSWGVFQVEWNEHRR